MILVSYLIMESFLEMHTMNSKWGEGGGEVTERESSSSKFDQIV